ncbi:hypothetical protein BCV71DRAFT_230451 [Rhizopus microsporus]|uniref:Tyr recombinase domain-containing protein n=1 Tax=Rhizopus microsporus TaxID=58291 RepID=A0A1X0RJS0_RHIZD|nr:hypothetical protein BCV71DRAFT_230451 [Rhizopus microsporus]
MTGSFALYARYGISVRRHNNFERVFQNHTLFLEYIQREEKHPKPSLPSTVANWVKEIMALAGIDTTQFKAHSTRSATSTKTYMTVVGVQKLKQHANRSLRTDTFERYYLRPHTNTKKAKQLLQLYSLLSMNLRKKTTTSEGKTKDMVRSHL